MVLLLRSWFYRYLDLLGGEGRLAGFVGNILGFVNSSTAWNLYKDEDPGCLVTLLEVQKKRHVSDCCHYIGCCIFTLAYI